MTNRISQNNAIGIPLVGEKLRELLADVERVCADVVAEVVDTAEETNHGLSEELEAALDAWFEPLQRQLSGLVERARDARLDLDFRQWSR
jgi:hypothetical protein